MRMLLCIIVLSSHVFASSMEIKNTQLKEIYNELNSSELQQKKEYFDGRNFNLDASEEEVKRYYQVYSKSIQSLTNKFNKTPKNIRSTKEGKYIQKLVYKSSQWGNSMSGSWRLYQMKLKKHKRQKKRTSKMNLYVSELDRDSAKKLCYNDFRKEYMIGNAPNIMTMIINNSLPKKMDPNMLAMVKETAEKVEAGCALPKYRSINSCKMFRMRPNTDPSVWCEKIKGWQTMLASSASDNFAGLMVSWDTRPLNQDSIKGEQEQIWFARKVPNREGWRNINRWADLAFSEKEKQALIKRYQKMYARSGNKEKVTEKTLAPVMKAHEDLLIDAKKFIGKWKLPRNNGTDYSVELAKKQHKTFTAPGKFIKAWLGRASWKIHKNALGVPLRRTKPGYMYYTVDGQDMCQVVSYTLTEQYQGGGKYLKANTVKWGYIRFHKCP
jgi:hypothetical protein